MNHLRMIDGREMQPKRRTNWKRVGPLLAGLGILVYGGYKAVDFFGDLLQVQRAPKVAYASKKGDSKWSIYKGETTQQNMWPAYRYSVNNPMQGVTQEWPDLDGNGITGTNANDPHVVARKRAKDFSEDLEAKIQKGVNEYDLGANHYVAAFKEYNSAFNQAREAAKPYLKNGNHQNGIGNYIIEDGSDYLLATMVHALMREGQVLTEAYTANREVDTGGVSENPLDNIRRAKNVYIQAGDLLKQLLDLQKKGQHVALPYASIELVRQRISECDYYLKK